MVATQRITLTLFSTARDMGQGSICLYLIALSALSGCITSPVVRTPSPLHLAAAERDVTQINQLLKTIDPNVRFTPYDPSKIDWRTYSTPLHWAATNGSLGMIEPMVSAGARIDARGTIGWTPLHCAAYAGHPLTCERLVEFGADLSSRANHGLTPLHLAASGGHPNSMTQLVTLGAHVNAPARNGETPLHLAAAAGHPLTVRRLLDLGADPELRTRDGERAVDLARLFRHSKTAAELEGS